MSDKKKIITEGTIRRSVKDGMLKPSTQEAKPTQKPPSPKKPNKK